MSTLTYDSADSSEAKYAMIEEAAGNEQSRKLAGSFLLA